MVGAFLNGGVTIRFNVGSIVSDFKASGESLLLIYGPTASGKSDLALALAQELGAEIISCDSVAIYKYFNIGTAKITPPHGIKIHLVDHVEPHEDYDAGRFAKEAKIIIDDLKSKHIPTIIVGGTGLYLRALFSDAFSQNLPKSEKLRRLLMTRETAKLYQILSYFDPDRAAELHPNDRLRIERAIEIRWLSKAPVRKDLPQAMPGFKIFINPPRKDLDVNIMIRTESMLDQGLIAEVQDLIQRGYDTTKAMSAIGYSETFAHIQENSTLELLKQSIYTHTRQYAKRQINWFKKLGYDLILG
jgi:tRNA dimethylallyltransferase